MGDNVLFLGWNRSIPGREQASGQHFDEFMGYLGGLQASGAIDSFQPVFLGPHGGDLNGFVLITGELAKIREVTESDEWASHMVRADLHLDRFGVVPGLTGGLVAEQMRLWLASVPG